MEKTLAETRLEEYKQAEIVCGKDNVFPQEKCTKYHEYDDDTCIARSFNYVCDDMEYAAMNEEERSIRDHDELQAKADSYCDYDL